MSVGNIRNIFNSGLKVGTNAGVTATLAGISGSKIKLVAAIGESDLLTNVEIRKELTGLVSTANGDATVTGTGTLFLTELAAGDKVRITDTGELLTVLSVTNNLAFEATANSGSTEASSKIYKIEDITAAAANAPVLPWLIPGLIESISGLGLQVALLSSTTDCHLTAYGGITH
jgi:hypothetical protein